MKIKVNPDRDIAEAVQEGLKRNNGYCPCVLEKTPDTRRKLHVHDARLH